MHFFRLLWRLYKMMQMPKKSSAQIKNQQEKQLRKLLRYAYQNSDYYRRTFEEAGISNSNLEKTPLSHFPTINKKQLINHFNDLITVPGLTQEQLQHFDQTIEGLNETFVDNIHVVHSSGSTSRPHYFVYDKHAWSQMVMGIIRGALWDMSFFQILKLISGGLRVLYIAATDGRYGGAMAAGGSIENLHAKQLYIDINTPLASWSEKIADFKPNFIVGYPSAMKILAELVEKKGMNFNIKRIVSCGEPLSASLRSYLASTFNTTIANIYGASESLAMGVDTSGNNEMYLFDDLNVIEVIDGEMYLTCLYNYTQPLIRYSLSDKLEILPEQLSKYNFSRANILIARDEDILWFTNKAGQREFLHPLSVEGFGVDGLLDYQFRQTAPDAFQMEAEIMPGLSEEDIHQKIKQKMQTILEEKGLAFVKYEMCFVASIKPNKYTGKKPLMIREDAYEV